MIILGLDPGIHGALALIDECNDVLAIYDMPIFEIARGTKTKSEIDSHQIFLAIQEAQPIGHAFIEMAGARPSEGSVSSFTNGKNYGVLLGVIGALSIPLTEVSPKKWKTALKVPAEKDGARFRASQLLPQSAFHWPLVKHHGRAEAALIALYGQYEISKMKGKP